MPEIQLRPGAPAEWNYQYEACVTHGVPMLPCPACIADGFCEQRLTALDRELVPDLIAFGDIESVNDILIPDIPLEGEDKPRVTSADIEKMIAEINARGQ